MTVDGVPVSKKQAKKFERLFAAQVAKWERRDEMLAAMPKGSNCGLPEGKDAAEGGPDASVLSTVAQPAVETESAKPSLPASMEAVTMVAGTFGNRQGMKMDCSGGPFTHVFVF